MKFIHLNQTTMFLFFCRGVKKITLGYQEEYVMQFLMGLNDIYSHIRGHILFIEPLATINKAFSMLI